MNDRITSHTANDGVSTFSPDASGVGADAGESLIARTSLALRLNVSLQIALGMVSQDQTIGRKGRLVSELVVPESRLFTIGHSNHTDEFFCSLLRQHEIDVLVDVRTQPYSQYSPQFNREALQREVVVAGRQYLFLGEELGGRPPEQDCYDDEGHVLYSTLARIPRFLGGIERVEKGIQKYRVALMCSEEDPTVCHRFLLVARVLVERGTVPLHIRGDGRLETHAALTNDGGALQRLLFPDAKEESWRSVQSSRSATDKPTMWQGRTSLRGSP